MECRKIFGVNIHNVSFEEATEKMNDFLTGEVLNTIYTPNTEIVMGVKDREDLRQLVNRGDLIVADGIGLIYASKIKKRPLKERVTGYYLSLQLIEIANKNKYSIYLLGCEDGVAKKAAENIIQQYPNVEIAGYHHGYFKGSHNGYDGHEEEKGIIDEINKTNPDIIFVGLGFPKQEIWIDKNKINIKSKIIIGNGGVMNILAGNMKPAPKLFENLGLEWLYRLIKEPSRIKRQIALPKFIIKVLLTKDAVK